MDSMDSRPVIGSWRKVKKSERGSGSRKYHYFWAFDDGESGFVLHTKKRKKYKMFQDSNENGILDEDDMLVSRGKFVEGFRDVKPGKLLPKNVDGLITAGSYNVDCEYDDHDDHVHDDHDDHVHDDHGYDHEICEAPTGVNALGIEHLSFLDADGAMVIHDHGDAHNHSHDHAMM